MSREIIAYIIEKIKKGKRIGFVYASSTLAEECAQYAELFSIKYVLHTKNSRELKVIRDLNESWSKVDLVIFSPTITTGVSYDKLVGEGAFDELVMYICQQSATIRDQFQMSMRFRHLTSNTITLFYGKGFDKTLGEPTFEYARSNLKISTEISVESGDEYINTMMMILSELPDSDIKNEKIVELITFQNRLPDMNFAWAERIAALNILETIFDKKMLKTITGIYAKHYNWNFLQDGFIPSIFQLEALEEYQIKEFNEIKIISSDQYVDIKNRLIDDYTTQPVLKTELDQMRKFEYLQVFTDSENSKIIFNEALEKSSPIKNFVDYMIQSIRNDLYDKKILQLNMFKMISKRLHIIDITEPGTHVHNKYLDFSSEERREIRLTFETDYNPDDIEFHKRAGNPARTGLLFNHILMATFGVKLIKARESSYWIISSIMDVNFGLKSIFKNIEDCPF